MKHIPITKRVNSHRSGNFPVNQEVTKKADGTGGPVNVGKKALVGKQENLPEGLKAKIKAAPEGAGKMYGKHSPAKDYKKGYYSVAKDYKKGYYSVAKQTRTEEEQKEREKFDIDMTNREEVVDYLMTEKGMDATEADSMYNDGGFTYEDYKRETKPPAGTGKNYKKGYYGK